ncbi:MAG: hypothetical protein VX346_21880 [Planctomycetota bacterium]|nr:hypothetical protein [Planctomycetota bacterium]
MGRPRKPLGVLTLAGTGQHVGSENAPQPGGHPKMTDWLDGEARGVETPALTGLCRWHAVWRHADARLQRDNGDSYKGSIEAAVWKHFSAMAAKFGLPPADREKISVAETTESENQILAELFAWPTFC